MEITVLFIIQFLRSFTSGGKIKKLKFPTPVFIMFQSNNGCCNPSVFRRFLFVKNTLIPALLLIQVLPRLGVC